MYAVEIEIELGEHTYVRKENPWTEEHKVWIFNNLHEAEEEAKCDFIIDISNLECEVHDE